MKDFCLDSDTLIYFLKGDKNIVANVAKIATTNLFTTRINYTELLYGAFNSKKKTTNLQQIHIFLDNFQILEFEQKASEIFAKLKVELKTSGKIINDMDLMIASIAINNSCTLVSNNTKHFSRIKQLKLDNWLIKTP